MKPLPEEKKSSAFVTDDGEFAWQRQHIFAALRAIADTGQAILGGDVWAVEDSKICSLFPESKGVRMWNTQPYKPNESWSEYCHRTCDESVREIEKTRLENNVSAELQQYISIIQPTLNKMMLRVLYPATSMILNVQKQQLELAILQLRLYCQTYWNGCRI